MTHDPHADDEFLQQVLTGERDESDPAVARILRERPGLAARLLELRALAERLDAVGFEDRKDLVEAREFASPLEGDVRAMLRRARVRRIRPLWFLLAAALAVLAFALLFRDWDGKAPNEQSTLGGTETQKQKRLAPAGEVRGEYGVFTWDLELPESGSYVLTFGPVGGGTPFLVVRGLEQPRWEPGPADLAKLKDVMEWQVEAFDLQRLAKPARLGPVVVRRMR